MKSLIAIIFVLLYGLVLLRPAAQVAEYYVALESYKEKCLNKTRPELNCDGSCLLSQKLKAMDAAQQDPAAPAPAKISMEEFPIGLLAGLRIEWKCFHKGIVTVQIPEVQATKSGFASDIFHPPA